MRPNLPPKLEGEHAPLVLLLAPLMLVVFAGQAFVAVWLEPALDALDADALAGWVAERLGLEAEFVGVRTARGHSNYALREVLGLLA